MSNAHIKRSLHPTRSLASMACFALLATQHCFAQQELQGKALLDSLEISGLGIVGRELAGEANCEPNSSGRTEAGLRDTVDGAVVASIQWKRGEHGSCEVYVLKDGRSEALGRGWDFPETNYEALGLVYYESRGAFARVLQRRRPPGLWVRVEDIPGGQLRPWIELLTQHERSYRGFEGLQLRSEPSTDSPALTTLHDRKDPNSTTHKLVPTGSRSRPWAQFTVNEFAGDFDFYDPNPPNATGRQWRGWLRVLDDSGQPVFWFYTRD